MDGESSGPGTGRTDRQHAEARFRAVVESSPYAILMADTAGKMIFANQQAEILFGYSQAELIGQSIDLLVPDRVRGRHSEYRREFEANPSTRPMGAGRDLYARRKDGTEIPVEIGLTTLKGPSGETLVLASIVDITRRKQAEQMIQEKESQLWQSQKLEAVGRLAGGVAHEINNILGVVMAMAETIRDGETRGDEAGIILNQAVKGSKIVKDLLVYSRPTSPALAEVRMDDIVQRAVRMAANDLHLRHIELKTDIAGSLPAISADADQIEQVLMNLIANARDAIPAGGTIEIRVEEKDFRIQTSVADRGTGIPPAAIDKIFDPFFSTKEEGKGTGLGLSVAAGIVKAHGGTIQAANRPGGGAVLTFHLPVSANRKTAGVEGSGSESPDRLPAGFRVLVVDDDEGLRESCVRAIESRGGRAVPAECVDEAVRCLDQETFEVVLCDYYMNRKYGMELYRYLTDQKRAEARHFILMTGLAPSSLEPSITVLTKPFRKAELIEALLRHARSG
ncbi:PAS domain S-box protein [bacterium]|nr:PAS domain S-box protein [bacterium]